MKQQAELNLAVEAARSGAELLLKSFGADAQIQSQAGKDIKTRADVEAEACILQHLVPSGLPVVAEESADASSAASGRRWLVDPLDGTMNFTRGFPMHAVSLALWDGKRPELGVVLDLARGCLYSGVNGVGAWSDDRPIHVSETRDSTQGVLATGFPTGRDFSGEALEAFVGRIQAFKKIRMIGSAALSLSYVASGVFDAYYEEDICLWDVAAGIVLVLAAGGKVWMTPPNSRHQLTVFASNGHLVPPNSCSYESLEEYSHA